MSALDLKLAQRLKDAVGPKGWSEDANEIAPHLTELRGRWEERKPRWSSLGRGTRSSRRDRSS